MYFVEVLRRDGQVLANRHEDLEKAQDDLEFMMAEEGDFTEADQDHVLGMVHDGNNVLQVEAPVPFAKWAYTSEFEFLFMERTNGSDARAVQLAAMFAEWSEFEEDVPGLIVEAVKRWLVGQYGGEVSDDVAARWGVVLRSVLLRALAGGEPGAMLPSSQ